MSCSSTSLFRFEVLATSRISKARVGRIHTPHGIVDTPGFVAVATNGALKHLDFEAADETGCQLVFCNTAHFLVNSGPDLVQEAGGLHKLINRLNRPLITDSSGFQVFSWGEKLVAKVDTDRGVTFRSYKDGRIIQVSPETSIQAQAKLGADIILVLDELLGFENSTYERTLASMERSHLWAERSLQEHQRLGTHRGQALYGIVHGGFFPDLRIQSARFMAARPFDGFALGGSLGVGPHQQQAREAVDGAVRTLPADKPRHLLGIGDLPSLRAAVPLGLDTFDSAFPTKLARHGGALIDEHTPGINVGRAAHTKEFNEPIDRTCPCSTCRRFSLAYLHHLQKAHEPVLATYLAIHNLTAIHRMMQRMRTEIIDGRL